MFISIFSVILVSQATTQPEKDVHTPLAAFHSLVDNSPIDAISYLRDSDRLAIHQEASRFKLFTTKAGNWSEERQFPRDVAHATSICCITESCAYAQDGSIMLWDVKKGSSEVLTSLPSGALPRSVALSSRCDLLAVGFDGDEKMDSRPINPVLPPCKVWILNVKSRQRIASFSVCPGVTTSIAFSHNDKMLAIGAKPIVAKDALVQVWNIAHAAKVAELKTHSEYCFEVGFSPQDDLLATADGLKGPGTLRIWDTKDWKFIRKLSGHLHGIQCFAFSPTADVIASGGSEVILWDIKTGENITRPGRATAIWDKLAERPIVSKKAVAVGARSMTFSPDGRSLAVGGFSGELTIWKLSSLCNGDGR